MLKSIMFSNDLLNLLFRRSAFPLGTIHLFSLQKRGTPIPSIQPTPKRVLCPYLQHVATSGGMVDAQVS